MRPYPQPYLLHMTPCQRIKDLSLPRHSNHHFHFLQEPDGEDYVDFADTHYQDLTQCQCESDMVIVECEYIHCAWGGPHIIITALVSNNILAQPQDDECNPKEFSQQVKEDRQREKEEE